MNLTLGCKEKVGEEWLYILKDGTRMSQKEWTSLVEQHVRENNKQAVLDRLKQQAGNRPWFKGDSPIDFHLQRYAATYCTSVEVKQQVKTKDKIHSKVANKEQFGQISLI